MQPKAYKTAWIFEDRSNMDKLQFDIVSKYLEEGRYSRYKELYAKYYAALYCAGMRRIEPFLFNISIIAKDINGIKYYKVRRANAKHFTKYKKIPNGIGADGLPKFRRKGIQRASITPLFRPENIWEEALWKFIAPNIVNTLDFMPLINNTLTKQSLKQLTTKFSMRFRADITDGESKVIKNGGIVPHMLRHARLFDTKIIHAYEDAQIVKLFGWDSRDMIDHYADIKSSIGEMEQLKMYERKPLEKELTDAIRSHSQNDILF